MRRRGIATGLKVSLFKYKTPMEFPVVHVSLFYKYFAPLEQVSLLNHKSRRDLLFVVVVFNSKTPQERKHRKGGKPQRF